MQKESVLKGAISSSSRRPARCALVARTQPASPGPARHDAMAMRWRNPSTKHKQQHIYGDVDLVLNDRQHLRAKQNITSDKHNFQPLRGNGYHTSGGPERRHVL
jgi:hypothetical protein